MANFATAIALKKDMEAFARKPVDEQADGVLMAYLQTFAGNFHTVLEMAEVSCWSLQCHSQ